jgi:predicted GTPase
MNSVVNFRPSAAITPPDDPPPLNKYVEQKLAVTHQVRQLELLCHTCGRKERESRCQELLVKLAEDRFTLAVVGQFKRGKSSLMNALIGRNLLPTGLLPLTSAITILRFGPRERLVVSWVNSGLEREESIAALADYVTEEGNPGNRRKVRAAYVEAPSPFLRRGLEFVDTPGIGSAIEANTATTKAFLPQCDAVVFVTAVDGPMTQAELDFLRRLQGDVNKLFCVINKTDLLGEPQRAQVIGFVQSQIRECLGAPVQVFAVSAQRELMGNDGGPESAEHASGIGSLRQALARFLSLERRTLLLRVVIERSLRLLAAEQAEIDLALRTAAAPAEIREAERVQIQSQFERIRQFVGQRIDAVAGDLTLNQQMPDLEKRLESLVADLADTAVDAGKDRRWELVGKRLARLTKHASEAGQQAANQWLRDRESQVWARISEISRDLRQAVLHLQREIDPSSGVSLVSLDDVDLSAIPSSAGSVRADPTPWSLIAPWWLRYLPARMVRASWLRWLRPRWQAYTVELKAVASVRLEDLHRGSLQRLGEVCQTSLRSQEESLLHAIDSPPDGMTAAQFTAPLEEKSKTARRIQDTLASQLEAITGEKTGSNERVLAKSVTLNPETAPWNRVAGSVSIEEVSRDLRVRGCPVCRRLRRILFDHLATWQYRMATDDTAQRHYSEILGFCPLHTWQLAAISSPQGLSAGYPRLTERLRTELRILGSDGADAEKVRYLLAGTRVCHICRILADAQEAYAHRLAEVFANDQGRRTYGASRGVCLKHLVPLLAAVRASDDKRFLLKIAADHLAMLSEDMQSFALKQGALRRHLINDEEQTALASALEKVAGVKSLCTPWEFGEIHY